MKRWLVGAMATLSVACGGRTCVARGTRIQTPKGPRRVEDLAVGDEAIAVNPHTGEHEVTTITHVRFAEREHGAISFGSTTLQVTSDHPLFDPVTLEFHPAGDWLLGLRTQLLSFTGETIDVNATKTFAGIATVFDLTVASALHTFVAEGIVVHNKQPPQCRLPDGGESVRLVGDPAYREPCVCEDGRDGGLTCEQHGATAFCDCDS